MSIQEHATNTQATEKAESPAQNPEIGHVVQAAGPYRDEAKPTYGRSMTTLGALGATLPVGLSPGNKLVKSLGMRPWRTREEKHIAKLKKPGINIAQHVGLVLACMCTEFGVSKWSDLPEKPGDVSERRVAVSHSVFGDVMYAYCWLRREAMGPIVKLNLTCAHPHCAEKWTLPADLDTLEVSTVDHPDALLWEYSLLNPLQIRGKKVGKLRMGAIQWHPVETVAGSGAAANDTMMKIAMLRSSIIGFNDDPNPIVMTDDEMDELSKRDLEALTKAMDDNAVGPKMAVEGECPKCHRPFIQSINWVYDSFFSVSSQ